MNREVIQWAGVLMLAMLLTILASSMVLAADSEFDDSRGALIVAVIAGSPASDANLERGDVILAVGEEPIDGNADLRAMMQAVAPGDVLPLTIRHGDDEYIVDVELGEIEGRAFLGVYLARDIVESAVEESAGEEPAMEESDEEAAEAAEADEPEVADSDAEEAATEETDAEEPVAEESDADETTTEDAEVESSAIEEAPADDDSSDSEEAAGEESEADMPDSDSEQPEADVVAEDAEAEDADAEAIDTGEAETDADEDSDAAEVFGLKPYTDTAGGAMIFAVVDDSPADEAGIKMGDVILGVDGDRLRHVEDLADLVDARDPGDEITLEVLRRTGDLEEVTAILGAHPDDGDKAFLGIGFLPTPRRMFLGHSKDGDLLVPPIPFFHHGPGFDGEQRWGHDPHHRFMPEGHPFGHDCEDGMPWWSCEADDDAEHGDADDDDSSHSEDDDGGDMDEDDSSDAKEGDNALAPMTSVA